METGSQTKFGRALAASAEATNAQDGKQTIGRGRTQAHLPASREAGGPTLDSPSSLLPPLPSRLPSVEKTPQQSEPVLFEQLVRHMMVAKQQLDTYKQHEKEVRQQLLERLDRFELLLRRIPDMIEFLESSDPEDLDQDLETVENRRLLLENGIREITSQLESLNDEHVKLTKAYQQTSSEVAHRLELDTETFDQATTQSTDLFNIPAVPDDALLDLMEEDWEEVNSWLEEQARNRVGIAPFTGSSKEEQEVSAITKAIRELKHQRSELQQQFQSDDSKKAVRVLSADIQRLFDKLRLRGFVFEGEQLVRPGVRSVADAGHDEAQQAAATNREEGPNRISQKTEHDAVMSKPSSRADKDREQIESKRKTPHSHATGSESADVTHSDPNNSDWQQRVKRSREEAWEAEIERTRKSLPEEAKMALPQRDPHRLS